MDKEYSRTARADVRNSDQAVRRLYLVVLHLSWSTTGAARRDAFHFPLHAAAPSVRPISAKTFEPQPETDTIVSLHHCHDSKWPQEP